MNKNVFLFDLDGVLADTHDIQCNSTFDALRNYKNVILEAKDDIDLIYSTIPTKDKLVILCNKGLIKENDIDSIYELKKQLCNSHLSILSEDKEKQQLFRHLKDNDCKIAVITNGNKASSKIILNNIGVSQYVDLLITNEDVNNRKPHPEPYIRAISHFGKSLEDYIIFEDSEVGLLAARATGVSVEEVVNVKDVNIRNISKFLYPKPPEVNILIPMAGLGSRFSERGFKKTKPLIDVDGVPMIDKVISSLDISGNYIFVVRNNQDTQTIKGYIYKNYANAKVIDVNYLTEGPASSCYLAKSLINNNAELIITNCDQYLEWNSNKFLSDARDNNYDCSVLTYKSSDQKNSFLETDDKGKVIKIIEKEVISDNALVGVHYFKEGKLFIESYEDIFKKNVKVKDEYYMSTVCNNMINKYNVGYMSLGDGEKYWSLGTPSDYFEFLKHRCNIKKYDLKDFHRGWLIGDFNPSLLKTKDFEVGYLLHPKGELWDVHYHDKLKEFNILVKGKMIINGTEINENDVFVFEEKQIACPIFLEDCHIVCIKVPSIPNDKVIL